MLLTISVIITCSNILVYSYVCWVVIKKRNLSKSDFRFFLVTFLSLLWIIVSFFQGFQSSYFTFLTFANYSLAALIAGALVSFVIHYPENNIKLKIWKEVILQAPIIIIAAISFTRLFVNPVTFKVNKLGVLYLLYLFIIVVYFIFVGGGVLISKYKKSKGIDKARLQFFATGYLIAISILLTESIYVNLIAPIDVAVDRLIFNSSIIFSSFSIYSMIKYRFLDIRIVIRRGLIQFLSLFLLFGFYLLLILFARDTLLKALKNEQMFVLGIVILIIIATFEPIRKQLYTIINKSFEKQNQKSEQLRKKTILILKSWDTYENLLQSIESLFKDFSETENVLFIPSNDNFFYGKPEVEVYLRSTGKILIPEELFYRFDEGEKFFHMHKELENSTYSALIPIGQDSLFTGFFGLGKRSKGNAYSVQEVRELRSMQDQFTEALLNARLYHHAVNRVLRKVQK